MGRLARKLGLPRQFHRKIDALAELVLGLVWVIFFVTAMSAGWKSEAKYDNTLGEPFYMAEQTQDPGEMANYLEEGIRGVEAVGLTTGNAVTIGQPRPNNDTAVLTASLRTLINRAREIDALDHESEAYQLGVKDVREQIAAADTIRYFERWTRLNGFFGATHRSLGWALWHSILLLVAGVILEVGLVTGLSWVQDKAYDWRGNESTA